MEGWMNGRMHGGSNEWMGIAMFGAMNPFIVFTFYTLFENIQTYVLVVTAIRNNLTSTQELECGAIIN